MSAIPILGQGDLVEELQQALQRMQSGRRRPADTGRLVDAQGNVIPDNVSRDNAYFTLFTVDRGQTYRYVHEQQAARERREREERKRTVFERRHYGNGAGYLTSRIARDRPDVLERQRAGEFRSVQESARAAGIVPTPNPEDRALLALFKAWDKADLDTRRAFLAIADADIEAAYAGELRPPPPVRRGPGPFEPAKDGTIPELEALIDGGEPIDAIARRLHVSGRTVRRWRAGQVKPNQRTLEALRALQVSTEEAAS
jgi:hypothetical protein